MNTIIYSVAILILFSIFYQVAKWIHEHLSLRKKLSSIPGPESLSLVGVFWFKRKLSTTGFIEWLRDLDKEYKDGMHIILRSPTLIKKSAIYDTFSIWLGNGLFTSFGDAWRRNRRLLTPAFHFNIFDQFTDIISSKVVILNDYLEAQVRKNSKGPVNIYPLIINFTLDVICETVMGVDMDLQRQPANEYVKSLHSFSELVLQKFNNLYLRNEFIFNLSSTGKKLRECVAKMHAFTMKIIHDKKKSREENKIKPKKKIENNEYDIIDSSKKSKTKALLDLLMDLSEADENPFSLTEIREQVDTFMFGGHDTTGVAISWILFCLGNEPEIQAKVHEELDDVFESDDEPVSKEKLTELKYLERVIKEGLRLYPSGPIISRCLDHDVEIDGHIIPKGVTVALKILSMHRDPKVWENSEKFDPDRFLPQNSHGKNPYAYLPFSAGPRNCIGQKLANLILKILLTDILKKWQVKSALKPSEINLIPLIVLTPHNETLNMYFTRRNKK